MTTKIKKIIAREGLVMIAFLGICNVGMKLAGVGYFGYRPYSKKEYYNDIAFFVKYAAIFYTVSCAMRFIIWAIRTLKAK